MSFGRWLKGATRIRFDDRTFSNLARNAGTIGGAAIGGPAGLALAAGGSALGRATAKGANFGNIVGAGVRGAGEAGALRLGTGAVRGLLNAGGSSVPSVAGGAGELGETALDRLPTGLTPSIGTTPTAAPNGILDALGGSGGTATRSPGLFRSALNTTGSFVKNNPTAAAMGLQAAGNLATAGAENRMNDAQADLLEQRRDETAYDFQKRRERDLALAPLWSQLGSTFASNNSNIAKNPYLPA